MTESVESRLEASGVALPVPSAPLANYVPAVRSGAQLFISGQLPMRDGTLQSTGKLGVDVTVEDAQAAARLCAINIVAQARAAIGDLSRVKRVVKLVGFVNSAPDFPNQPAVINGASDFMVEAFGKAGEHARSAVGVAALPFNASVEVEAILEIE